MNRLHLFTYPRSFAIHGSFRLSLRKWHHNQRASTLQAASRFIAHTGAAVCAQGSGHRRHLSVDARLHHGTRSTLGGKMCVEGCNV